MADTIAWYCTFASTAGAKLTSDGETPVGATLVASSVSLDPAMGVPRGIRLQLDSVDDVAFLAIRSSLLDGSVEVQAGGAPTTLTGPLVLFGDAVGLFTGDLTTLQATNTHADQGAELSVLVGIDVGD